MSLLNLLSLSILLLSVYHTYSSLTCEPFECGGLNISYPFSLYDQNTLQHCGIPGFLVSCENNTAILHFHSDNYILQSINYDNRTITVVDNALLQDVACPRVQNNVSFFTDSGINYTSSDTNITFFFGCNVSLSNYKPISCFIGAENGNSYVFRTDTLAWEPFLYANSMTHSLTYSNGTASFPADFPAAGTAYRQPYLSNLTSYCLSVVVAPVLEYYLEPYNNTDLNTSFGMVLKQGFQLGWNSTNTCTECQKKNGKCGYTLLDDNSTYAFNCNCLDGSCDGAKSHRSGGVATDNTDGAKSHRFGGVGVATDNTGHGSADADGANRHIYLAVVIGIFLLLGLLAFCIGLLFYARKNKMVWFGMEERKKEKVTEVALENFGSLVPKRYTFSEIKKITKYFNQKIGQGGHAGVFKGELMDGIPVAVKVFKDRESTGVEFTSEVLSIARTSHINIVRLLGFSIKGSKRALIYEFMRNGSLDKYLHDIQNSTLSHVECTKLFQIAVGIARGLEYLHRGCNTRIVHFDIKPHNILLDEDYCPKISDFGLAKFCQPKESMISMSGWRGTRGYIAPEVFYWNCGVASSKSDVYSYGMMLLEMFGKKQCKMELTDSSSETYFPDYIYKSVEENNICSVYGISDVSEEIVRKVTIVGLWCIQMMPHARPTMSTVLEMFDRSIAELALPPRLNFSLPPVLVKEGTDLDASSSFDHNDCK